jgi:UDP-N-acetylmuramate dehydrogenase
MNDSEKFFLINHLKESGCSYREDCLLKYSTYFKYGGKAEVYIVPTSISELENVILFLYVNNIDYKIVGNTSNVIFLESAVYSVILSTKFVNTINIDGDIIECGAGVMLEDLVRVAMLNKATGYEGLEGIPGTVGGGVFMNAGSYGTSISEHLISVKAIDSNGNIVYYDNKECIFSRRNSLFKMNPELKILSARFKIISEGFNLVDSANRAEIYHIARHSYQEYVLPNLGSMFTLKSDIYRKVLTINFYRHFWYFMTRAVFTNKFAKFMRRKKPTNRHLNALVKKYENIEYPTSHKSMNILVNDGEISDLDVIEHLLKMKALIKDGGELENEIVVNCISEISEEVDRKLNVFNLTCRVS